MVGAKLKHPVHIVASYAHEDDIFRKQLKKHLSALIANQRIFLWSDCDVQAGAEKKLEIATQFKAADIILLLISSDFLDSHYCNGNEVQLALDRHKAGKARIIPIILRPVSWEDTPVGDLQCLPSNRTPVTTWRNEDEAFLDIVLGIGEAIKTVIPKKSLPPKGTIALLEETTALLDEAGQRLRQQKGMPYLEGLPLGTLLHSYYRIERMLGGGGFGIVYLSLDLTTNQLYVLKEYIITAEANAQERFKHEATILSQLCHPNLPALHEVFVERGRSYIVLNYIEGSDLTDIIRIARLHNEAVPIFHIMNWQLSICDAVMFLHAQHPPVIHRDIKPDNIRITSDGTAILVDLGNAKPSINSSSTPIFIRSIGTPGYAPPEQYPGGSGTDRRSDVYALGGTLYFALTTHEPPSVSTRNQGIQQNLSDLPTLQECVANNPPEESAEANSARQFRLGVTRPSKPAPRHSRHLALLGTLPPEVLKELNRVMARSMAMLPKDRYQSVADFADDLRRVMVAIPPAKENATSSMADASTPLTVTNLCLRCGASLYPHTTLCLRCGTPVQPAKND